MDLAAIARAMQADLQAPGAAVDAGVLRPVGVQIDSRKTAAGELFFCIPGERFDGHDFAAQAVAQGAMAVVAERDIEISGAPVLRVDGVVTALGRLARAHRDAAGATVVGVTGSAGKTTVKELLAAICSQAGPTAKNHLNLNNQVGLPLSMLRADAEAAFWVMEAGINYEGEMDILGSVLAPDLAVVVNVGGAHTQGLGGVAGVARNKTLLFEHLQPGGVALISADYPELVQATADRGVAAMSFSVTEPNALYKGRYLGPDTAGQGRYVLEIAGERLEVSLPWRGEFMAENVVAAAAAAHLLRIGPQQIRSGLLVAQPAEHRFQRIQANGLLMVDDAYNANPLSMGRSIAGARDLAEGRPLVLVLGEMRELGEQAATAHEELGRTVARSGAAALVWRGDYVEDLQRGLEQGGFAGSFVQAGEAGEFLDHWRRLGPSQGVVLFKGSRSMRMEEFCEALQKELHA